MTFIVNVQTSTFVDVEAETQAEANEIALAQMNTEYPKLDWWLEDWTG